MPPICDSMPVIEWSLLSDEPRGPVPRGEVVLAFGRETAGTGGFRGSTAGEVSEMGMPPRSPPSHGMNGDGMGGYGIYSRTWTES